MTLELTLLMTFVGMIFVSTIGDRNTGLNAQFRSSAPALALRMEKRMTTGKCFQLEEKGKGQVCRTTLWNGAVAH